MTGEEKKPKEIKSHFKNNSNMIICSTLETTVNQKVC